MGLLTKLLKPVADYQQWAASELANGDIIDVFGSLGNRSAHSVTIESLGGASTIRFNVAHKIFKDHGSDHNPWVGLGMGATRSSPLLVDEVKEAKPNIVVELNSTQTWTAREIAVSDIEIVAKSSGLKITVT